MKHSKHYITFIGLILVCFGMFAQNFSTSGWWKPAEPPFSPVVHADNSITFRIKAPNAQQVKLYFDEWDVKSQELTKDNNGVWSITIPPVAPRTYQYSFEVDGVTMPDMANPDIKAGTSIYGSIVEVHGNPPRYDEYQNVTHGEVDIIRYTSTPLQRPREMYVYVPAAYQTQRQQSFPVLYLRHGGGDNESSWYKDGRVAYILDNLIASGNAVPMLVVMSNGMTDGTWAGGSSIDGMAALEKELLTDIIPLIEKRYRVKANRANRAIAGLSMGGGQAFVIGLRHVDLFSAIGQFSSGLLSDPNFDFNAYLPGVLDKPEAANRQLDLLWISCGTKDSRYQGHLALVENLKKHGIRNEFYEAPYGHEWEFWRLQLRDFAQRLFRPTGKLTTTDPLATPETQALYVNLLKINQKGVMFGHHDYPSYGVGWSGDKDRSDVKDLVGDHPAVYSLDMQGINAKKIEQIRETYERGGISILVWHQNNPLTEGSGKTYPAGTAWDNTKVVDKILQEGSEMNIKYKQRLDKVAEAFHAMKDKDGKPIPVIFRPLHEHTQRWNWWGSSATTEEEFIAFWRFIVHYLRDVKNVHNVLYAISPQMDEVYPDAQGRLLYRWPGDDYVDFLGMDCYHHRNTEAFRSNLQAMTAVARKIQKPVGVTETGLEKDHTADYWTKSVLEPLKENPVSMVVAWRNEKPSHAFGPYPDDASAADFVQFYQDPLTLFEKNLPDMYRMPETSFLPVNPKISPEAKQLLEFLYSINGKYTLTGQHNFVSDFKRYDNRVYELTGKHPVVWGADFSFMAENDSSIRKYQHCGPMNLTVPWDSCTFNGRTKAGLRQSLVNEAIAKHAEGRIITLMWHCCFPTNGYECDGGDIWRWAGGLPTDKEWAELTTDGTPLNKAWKKQLDGVAIYLKQLQKAKVPVLWRPYHEMNGVWFWWCNKPGKDGFQKLYINMYNYFTQYHKLNNLLWVWNTNAPRNIPGDKAGPYEDYFPGREYVDVLTADVYRQDYKQSHHDDILKTGGNKLIALGEVGDLPTVEQYEAQPNWSWFMVWGYFINRRADQQELVRTIYNHPRSITLDEIDFSDRIYKLR